MDYLPFIDDELDLAQYEAIVSDLVKEEVRELNPEQSLHPEAERISTNNRQLANNELLNLYQNEQGLKRPYEEDRLLKDFKTKFARIDLARYSTVDQNDADVLGAMDSYLRHQELHLEHLLPRTLLNQWVINNDFLAASDESLQMVIENQEKQIQSLNLYRKRVQIQNEPVFNTYEQQWKSKLIERLNLE